MCRQFRLLVSASFIGRFVSPVGGIGVGNGYRYLACWDYHFNRVHENLVQHLSNYIDL